MLPNFLVIGAPRSGTTSLYEYLRAHPDIYMSPVKEPDFFAHAADALDAHRAEYEHLFDGAGSQSRRGEASAVYLGHPNAPDNIRRLIPDVKMIVVLRDPAERLYSHFVHAQRVHADAQGAAHDAAAYERAFLDSVDRAAREGFVGPGTTEHDEWLRSGFYFRNLTRFRETFDPAQIKVWRFEDLVRDPRALTTEVYQFLGVDATFTVPTAQAFNASVVPKNRGVFRFFTTQNPLMRLARAVAPTKLRAMAVRTRNKTLAESKPTMDPVLRQKMVGIYRDDILQAQELLGWDLSAWLATS